jgi:hypothetical protein
MTMKPEEHIKRAEELCGRIRSASAMVGSANNQRLVKGADPNELKKILSFMMANREDLGKQKSLESVRKLVEGLQASDFSKRSGSTPAYYKNIQSAFSTGFYSMTDVDDAVQILGWACRLL